MKYDILTLCETRCDDVDMEYVKASFRDIDFDLVYKNRSILNRYKSGGLAIAITNKKKITWKVVKHSFEALLSIKVDKSSLGTQKDIIFTSVYIPPSHSRYGNVLHFEELDNLLLNHSYVDNYHFLGGDFNAHTGVMKDIADMNDENDRYLTNYTQYMLFSTHDLPETRANKDTTPDRSTYGKKLVEVCRNNYVMIYNGRLGDDKGVGKVTTTYGTTIDYVIGSRDLAFLVSEFSVLNFDPLYSDVHCGLCTRLEFDIFVKSDSHMPSNEENSEKEKQSRPGKWKEEKKEEYLRNIDKRKVNSLLLGVDELSIDEISHRIKEIIIEPAIVVFPPLARCKYIKKSNNASMEGYDSKCIKSRKEYHKAKHKYNVRKNNANFVCMINKSRKYKQEMKRVHRKQKSNMVKKLRETKTKDPTAYWKIIKGKKKTKDIPVTLLNFYQHFQEISNEDYGEERIMHDNDNEGIPSQLNDPITSHEIMKCIRKLKNKKSAGVDYVLNEYIKTTKDVLCPLYEKLFNKILDTGVFPNEWLVGIIIPLYKNKGNTDDCNNYRGITLLSCMGKLFTSILNERLKDYSETFAVINENQAGFRAGYSTLDHMFVLKCIIDLYKWKKKKLFCLFVDYSKAFDMVWREGLWCKLVKSNITGKILNVIKSMYENIKSCVMLKQELSDTFLCNVGVRQGENLSPMLFAYYVNDIEEALLDQNCKYINFNDDFINSYIRVFVLMYADDTVIMSDNEDEMKQILTSLSSYCTEWKLKLNCSKTKIVVFNSSKNNINNYSFQYNNEQVEVISEYKYLGITMNYNGRFRNCQLQLIEQAKRAMYSVIGTSRKYDLPVDIQLEMFNNMVSPVLLYGSEVWGYNTAREIEFLHLKYIKHVLFVHSKTSNDIVYGELGVYPLEVTIKCKIINFWVRLINGKTSKLSYLMYCCLLELYRRGVYLSPWLTYIRDICNNCGMPGVWLSHDVTNATWFKKAIEQRLKDQWITTWNVNLATKSTCITYKLYKHTYSLEEYLLKLDKSCRVSLTRIRASNNKLPVVVGRYNNRRREERVCGLCDEGEVGDEYHILLSCQNEQVIILRNKYIVRYYRENPSMFKFNLLMQSTNINVMKNLSLFVASVLRMFR